MYRKSLRVRLLRVTLVLAFVAGVSALVFYRGRIGRFLMYLDARVSQEGAAQAGTLTMLHNPRIVVSKSERRLYLSDGDTIVRSYRIGLGLVPIGHKEREGDGRTPEGAYYICVKNPESRFNLSLGISYPNVEDAGAGLDAGLITKDQYEAIADAITAEGTPPWDTPLGGEIFLHGHGASRDWTAGCVALDDNAIEELYRLVDVGTPVTITP